MRKLDDIEEMFVSMHVGDRDAIVLAIICYEAATRAKRGDFVGEGVRFEAQESCEVHAKTRKFLLRMFKGTLEDMRSWTEDELDRALLVYGTLLRRSGWRREDVGLPN